MEQMSATNIAIQARGHGRASMHAVREQMGPPFPSHNRGSRLVVDAVSGNVRQGRTYGTGAHEPEHKGLRS